MNNKRGSGVCVREIYAVPHKSLFGHTYKPRLFLTTFSSQTMICPGIINTFLKRISEAEIDIQEIYRLRDTYKFGSREWLYHQDRINQRQKRLNYLRGVVERMKEETLTEGAWG